VWEVGGETILVSRQEAQPSSSASEQASCLLLSECTHSHTHTPTTAPQHTRPQVPAPTTTPTPTDIDTHRRTFGYMHSGWHCNVVTRAVVTGPDTILWTSRLSTSITARLCCRASPFHGAGGCTSNIIIHKPILVRADILLLLSLLPIPLLRHARPFQVLAFQIVDLRLCELLEKLEALGRC
jgi:hypothetical protein